jgi:Tfp pilus assembly protein PilF
MLRKALEIDPEFAPSYAVLADLYNTFGNYVAIGDEEKQKYLDLQEKYIEVKPYHTTRFLSASGFGGWAM